MAMLLMGISIVLFVYIYQRKMIRKQHAYAAIEQLLHKEELKSAYAQLEGKEIERKRISEDLHDNIGSLLATMRMYSDLLLEIKDPAEVHTYANKISALTEQTAIETRRISHDLDSGFLHNFGLRNAIERLIGAITMSQRLDIKSVIEVHQEPENELSINVYRVIQELFNNTLKHAKASQVRIEVTQIPGEYLSIIFEDNGKGFDVSSAKAGIGIQNIRTRVERFHGQVNFHSTENRGTTCIIEIPQT
ncbi:MAG TPA: ATP-binding protein [Chryseosolibacter sp.]|nr:ATP-binding protein [Chryseosolibacter sp.]